MDQEYNGVIGIVFQRINPVKYALIHNKKTGNITFPAGGREDDDSTIEDTLKRELKEELGLENNQYKIIKTNIVHEFVYNSNKKERTGKVARQPVYLIETEVKNFNPEDSDAEILGWFIEEEVIDKLTFSDSKELFKKAIKYISD